MSEPFLAEIRPFGFNFAPRGWAQCDGQLVPINQYQAVFSLLGTTYGGDGRTSFGLPELRGRVPVHAGGSAGPGLSNLALGQKDGVENVTLSTSQIPSHTHSLNASSDTGTTNMATGNVPANSGSVAKIYGPSANLTSMNAASVLNSGGNQAHNNMQPFLTINYCIALEGLFPSRN